jgi:hypothetical protein
MTETNKLVAQVQATVAKLREQKKMLVAERETLCLQRHALNTAPVPPEDAKAFLFNLIDEKAAAYAQKADIGRLFQRVLYPPNISMMQGRTWDGGNALCYRDMMADASERPVTVFEDIVRFLPNGVHSVDGALCYFMGDTIKRRLEQEWERCPPHHYEADATHVGAPVSERRELLATIESRMAEIAAQCTEIDGELSALGSRAPDADLVVPDERFTARDAQILQGKNRSNWNSAAITMNYGVSPAYAEYLRRKLPEAERDDSRGPVRMR